MCDTCDLCEGLMLMGKGAGCKKGASCSCRCHHWDARTCSEIVLIHKRADSSLNVLPMKGLHRNKILSYLCFHMTDDAVGQAYDINMTTPGHDGPPRTDCLMVPNNIGQLASCIKPVDVIIVNTRGAFMCEWKLKSAPAWKDHAMKLLGKPKAAIKKKQAKGKKPCRTT